MLYVGSSHQTASQLYQYSSAVHHWYGICCQSSNSKELVAAVDWQPHYCRPLANNVELLNTDPTNLSRLRYNPQRAHSPAIQGPT